MDSHIQNEIVALLRLVDIVENDLPQREIAGKVAHKIYIYPPIRAQADQYVSRDIYLIRNYDDDKALIAYEVLRRDEYESEIRARGKDKTIRLIEDEGFVWAIVDLAQFLPSLPLFDLNNFLIRSTKSGRLLYAKKVIEETRR